ncbi:MAG: hypothetical protein WBP45_05445 [Daejeonella sp.]
MMITAERNSAINDNWNEISSSKVTAKSLRSNGFGKARFVLLQYRNGDTSTIADSVYKLNKVPISCDYVVVYYSGIFFRLKGFINNDFYQFLTIFSETSDVGYDLKNEIFSTNNIQQINKKLTDQNIFIEDLDVICLYNYYRVQESVNKKIQKLKCLSSCVENDRKRYISN